MPHRWWVWDGDMTHHGTSPHHCRSCWARPDRSHPPPCCQAGLVQLWNIMWSVDISIKVHTTDPPVWDHSTLLWARPLGHLMFPLLTLPPVQKNLWPSRATRFLNSASLASLSILRDLMPLARQKLSPCCLVKLLHPIFQLTRKFCPPNWWLGEWPPPHLPPNSMI